MVANAIDILDEHRVMTVATLRPDGWPQATIVGYANDGLDVYFLVARTSQKLVNVQFDDRIAIAVGEEPRDDHIQAVYAAANAVELVDPEQRARCWQLLRQRHRNLADYDMPGPAEAAMFRAECHHVSALDFISGDNSNWPSTMERLPGTGGLENAVSCQDSTMRRRRWRGAR